jgi:signal recognition particle GTPase
VFDKLRGAINKAVTKATTKELTDKNLSDAVWELQLVLIQNDVAVEVAEHICHDNDSLRRCQRNGEDNNTSETGTPLQRQRVLSSHCRWRYIPGWKY